MRSTRSWTRRSLALVIAGLTLAAGTASAQSQYQGPVPSPKGDGSTMTPMRRMKHEDRMKAALRQRERMKAHEAAKKKAGPSAAIQPQGGSSLSGMSGAAASAILDLAMAQLGGTPDLYAEPNYALSKLPTAYCSVATTVQCQKDIDCPGYAPPFLVGANTFPGGETCTGPVVAGTGIKKFVDPLPGLCGPGATAATDCIPVAVPNTTTFPGEHYYEIGLRDYTRQFHSDLPAAKVRGYYQINTTDPAANSNHYLGPVIVGVQGTPIRVKFVNKLGAGAAGALFIPVDTNISGTGLGPLGPGGGFYTENRATIHLHGGNTPWISDGTQHQWTVPVGDSTTQYQRGVSARDVPDMWFDANGKILPASSGCQGKLTCDPVLNPGATTYPGQGALTFYWPNQQSSRLMFYHDHAYGITRLNVHVGEAAGFVLTDAAEQQLISSNLLPGLGTPLVIQDKTFVPPDAQLTWQDRTWDATKWGGEGSIWYPHVYTPNQWPGNPDLSNTNAYGRWDYGPFFHPVQTQLVQVNWAGNPTVLTGPQLFTPCTTAALGGATTDCPITPLPSLVPESFFDTPLVNGTAYPKVSVPAGPVRFRMLNAAQERNFNLSWFVADSTGTEVVMVDAIPHSFTSIPKLCTPTAAKDATTGLPIGCWPIEWPADARQGGVPDPTTAGPQWIQVGSESGFLPAPALIPAMPVGYETNKRNVVVLNVANKGLFMGPAERADVIVDFSKYPGKTLILYNDAPAPVPAGDPRQDYYTGAPDMTLTGGAPTTLPGYGPNIRTVMQVYVDPSLPKPPPVDLAALGTALKSTFVSTQLVPIVPERAYDKMYPTQLNPTGAIAANTYFGIGTLSATFTPVGSDTAITLPFGNKALHELFTTDFGRMNSLLGVEIPNTNWLNQTTIPFANFDPTTEFIIDGVPQIWKITHNGVDTHTIHFHLLNAQIVNRVGWDGQIRAPDANELGWKEAIRMNPLEDIFIALQPYRQSLPWPLPDMKRLLDVDRPAGSGSQFTGVNIYNEPIAVTNHEVNLGWEYVWHCHLLGHEEEDMLRAEVFVVAPETPIQLTAVTTPVPAPPAPATGVVATLTWTDASKSAMTFTIQRADDSGFNTNLQTWTQGASGPQPGQVTFIDTSIAPNTPYYYRVKAEKVLTSDAVPTGPGLPTSRQNFSASSPWSAWVLLGLPPVASVSVSALAFPDQTVFTPSAVQTFTLSNAGPSPLSFTITVAGANAGDFVQTNDCGTSLAAAAGTPLAPTTCTVSVTFTPAAAGPRVASVAINSNDPIHPTLTVGLTGTGIAPAVGIAPASLVFGNQLLSVASAVQNVTLSNSGTAALTNIVITLPAGDFVQTNTCGGTLAAGTPSLPTTCTISVVFTPTVLGARSASMVITSSDPVRPSLSVPLTGTGVQPALSVSPTSLGFGTVLVNNISATQVVTVSNPGTAPLTITSIAIGGTNPTQFGMVNGCGAPGATLAAGATCTVSLTFRPTAAGPQAASLTVSGAAASPSIWTASQSVALSGTGTALNVSTTALAFGNQTVGTQSPNSNVTLTNNGTTPIAMNSPPFTWSVSPVGAPFTFTTNCGTSLGAGASCRVSIRFAPTTTGPVTGTMNILNGDAAGPQSIALSGNGVAPGVVLSTNALTFSSALNVTSAAQTITVTNSGSAAATINGINIGGTNPNQFGRTTTCGATLAIGATCTIDVTFLPTSANPPTKTATLNLNLAAPGVSQMATLTGNVLVPTYTVSPSPLSFSSPLNVTSAAQVVTVTNTSPLGGASLSINSINVGGTNANQFTRVNGCGARLAPQASCTVSVTFRPTAANPLTKNATLTMSVAAPAANTTVALTGAIVVPTFSVAPTPLAFGNQTRNTTSAPRVVTVTNTSPAVGGASLSINSINVAGRNANQFNRVNNCPATLAPQASCTVSVTFRPTSAGVKTSSLNVNVAAPATSMAVPLSGTGL